jgi:methylmalonyl-CoA mutase N-terminal domain/subunit
MGIHDSEQGDFPFDTGIYRGMYTVQPWKIRQYSGYGSASDANRKFKEIISNGGNGISIAFDLPTQMGLDPSSELAKYEVGKVGVSIDSIDDMRRLFDDIEIEKISVSMTINATAAMILILYQIVAEERNLDTKKLSGTIQNDILKEYICRNTYIFPINESLRLTADIFEYCSKELPAWNPISVSGYHFEEAGATVVQEVSFALQNGFFYLELARARGLDLEQVSKKFTFFFSAKTNIFEETVKFRVARKIWAEVLKNKYGIKNEQALKMRIHAQTAGSQLTAYSVEDNIIRVALQSLSAIFGGVQSLHTNGFDEAVSLPTSYSSQIAIDTQKIIMHETDLTLYVDPIGGSLELQAKMELFEAEVLESISSISDFGGIVKAIEDGLQKSLIEKSALDFQEKVENGSKIIIRSEFNGEIRGFEQFDFAETSNNANLNGERAPLKQVEGAISISELIRVAQTRENLLYAIKGCLMDGFTVSQICSELRKVWGSFIPSN